MTELTICVPARNAADTIERALRSIRPEEVGGALEVLVCDDGSTDQTVRVVTALAEDMPHVKLIENGDHLGRPATRNRLLAESRGRFLGWLDADDEKYPGMLAAQLDHLRTTERRLGDGSLAGLLVCTNYDWIPSDGPPHLVVIDPPDDPLRGLLDSSFGAYLWLMMGLRETFVLAGPFDEQLPRLQDLGFLIRFAELGGRFERVDLDDPLCAYHKHDRGRDARCVWRSWNHLWHTYRHHYRSYGPTSARAWRRHQYRVSRRYARVNGDRMLEAYLYGLEATWLARGRISAGLDRAARALRFSLVARRSDVPTCAADRGSAVPHRSGR